VLFRSRFYNFDASPCNSYVDQTPVWYSKVTAMATYGTLTPSITDLFTKLASSTLKIVTSSSGSQTAGQGFLNRSIVATGDSTKNFLDLAAGTVDVVFSGGPAIGVLPQVGLFTGTTVTGMISSFFRKPVLVGAAVTASTPKLASLAYPPAGNAAAVGLEELKLAYAAGFAKAVQAGKWTSSFGAQPSLVQTEACTSNFANYPFPTATAGGQLANIIAKKKLVIGFNKETRINSGEGTIIISSIGGTVSGPAVLFIQAIVDAINAHYNSAIVIEWALSYVLSEQFWSDLDTGKIDVFGPATAVGSTAMGLNRNVNFDGSLCRTWSTSLTIYVQTASPITSLAQLLAWVKAGNATLLSESAANAVEVSGMLGIVIPSDPTAMAKLVAGSTTAALGGLTDAVKATGQLRALPPVSSTFRTAFFKKAMALTTANVVIDDSGDENSAPSERGGVIALGIICALLVVAVIALAAHAIIAKKNSGGVITSATVTHNPLKPAV